MTRKLISIEIACKKREREIKLPFLGAPKFMRHTCLQLKKKIST